MQIVLVHTYHKDHKILSNITTKYYESMGYKVDRVEADFLVNEEATYRNEFINRNPDADYLFHIDSDEVITKEDMLKAAAIIERVQLDVYRVSIIDYISPTEVLKEARIHKPIMAVKRSKTRFTTNRNVKGCTGHELLPINIHHLGYLTKSQCDFKINNYMARYDLHELGNVTNILNKELKTADVPQEISIIIKEYIELVNPHSSSSVEA